jgi:hypothetical protein
MSQADELKLQRCAAPNAEREQGNESGQNRNHHPDGMAAVPEIPQSLSTVHSFEQRQGNFHATYQSANELCGPLP